MKAVGRDPFGELLKRFRLHAGMTQSDLAERAKLSVEAISTLERGARTRPHVETVTSLARALDLPPQREVELRSAVASSRRPQRDVRSLLGFARSDNGAISHSNLPKALTSFVGRETELSEIAVLLRQHRVVTVVGAGGVGKTRAAVELARGAIKCFPDGVWLVDFAPLAHEGAVGAAVLAALRLFSSMGPTLEAAIAYLRTRHLLLIFDNCEHVINRARDVAASIVQECPSVQFLATSRRPLQVAGECVYRLASLSVPQSPSVQDALSHGATALFVDRARVAHSDFTLTDDSAAHVTEICRRLDGIPLAIELAAARMNVLTPRQTAERLDRRFRLLRSSDPRTLPRHQTMQALFDWSYDLLTPREQRFFESLSIFAGGGALEAVTEVCAADNEDDVDVIELISSLVTKSLLVAESVSGEQRYCLLESSRQYARDKLIALGEHERIARRHAFAYLHIAERFEQEWNTTSECECLERAQVESENWRAALEWALVRCGDVELGQRLAAIRGALPLSFSRTESQQWVRTALDAVDKHTPLTVVAQLEHAAADCARRLGDFKASLAAATRALARYRELDDILGATQARSLAGVALACMGRPREAAPMLRDALKEARSMGDRRMTASILMRTGIMQTEMRNLPAARGSLAEAVALASAIGAGSIVSSANIALAGVEFLAGDAEAALRLAANALANSHTLNQLPGIAYALSDMALYLTTLGRYDEARARSKEALELAQRLRLRFPVARSLQHLASAAVLQPLDEGAAACADHATAARIFGFVGAQVRMLGSADEFGPAYDRALAVLGGELGDAQLRELMSAGAKMSEVEAVQHARAFG